MNQPLPPFALREHPLGHVFEDADVTVFFGDRRSTPDAVANAFPDFRLSIMKQVHSDVVLAAASDRGLPEGDAQISRERRLALCVRTADCVPVLLFDPTSKSIAGVHAGWRGIENEIIRKTCAKLAGSGSKLSRARAWIGPHIGASSFEVDLDVAARLEARFDAVRGFSADISARFSHDDRTKALIDLAIIARAQLVSCDIDRASIIEQNADTFASPAYASFRREKENAGRQISFIALK